MKKVLTGTDGSSIISYVATHKRCEARIDAWLSLVERCVRDAEVAGSNPVASIFLCSKIVVFKRFSGISLFRAFVQSLNFNDKLTTNFLTTRKKYISHRFSDLYLLLLI